MTAWGPTARREGGMTLEILTRHFTSGGMDAVEAAVRLGNESRMSQDDLDLVIELARSKAIEANDKKREEGAKNFSLLD